MKTFTQFLFSVIIVFVLANAGWGQTTWNYDFGTGTGVWNTNAASTTFLPAPPTNGGTARVRVGTGGGSMELVSPSGNSSLIITAPTSTSVNKFSIYDYTTASKSFTIRFKMKISGGSSGNIYFFNGDGAQYSDNTQFAGAQVFTGIRWVLGTSGTITSSYRNAGNWSALSGTPFAQNVTYIVDIYSNNTTTSASYNYNEVSYSVAANKFDLWVDGVLVGDDLSKATLPNDANMDSFMFYSESSTGNVAKIELDDIYYRNQIPEAPLPVNLQSFNSNVLSNSVKLQWKTVEEINNAGFEVQRSVISNQLSGYSKIGFVEGKGTKNSATEYAFEDRNLNTGKYKYRLKQVDVNGNYEYYELNGEVEIGVPKKYDLSQNYPNPFNPLTKINFDLPENGLVNIRLYDMLGREVGVIVNEVRNAGYHTVQFDASKLSSGIYFYKMNAGKFSGIKKMAVLK